MSNQEVFDHIINHINKYNFPYSNWYIGIASEAKDCLFNRHNVDENNGHWVYALAESDDNARYVEKYIIDNYKTKGGGGGGDSLTKYVYAYHITSDTRE